MKNTMLVIIGLLAFSATAFTQNPNRPNGPPNRPEPQPTPAPILQPTAEMRATAIATSILSQSNSFATNLQRMLEQGVPAQGNNPAVKPDDIKKVLGPDNTAKLTAALKALKGK